MVWVKMFTYVTHVYEYKLKQVNFDFWFHTGHELWSPE